MESLFTFIGKYKPLENMDPQENYLTQIFAWILHDREEYRTEFVRFLSEHCTRKVLSVKQSAWSVSTQVPVTCGDGTRGYIDMVLENEEASLIFEHKVRNCLGDDQIGKYLASDEFRGKNTYSVLIACERSQFTQEADIRLTWRDVHRFTRGYRKMSSDFLVGQFEQFLVESGMGTDTPFTKEEIARLRRADYHYDEKLTRLFSRIEQEICADPAVVDRLRTMDPEHVFHKGRYQRGNRWGRIGIDCLSNDSDYWNPGLFIGVLCNGNDHGIPPLESSSGPDFCIMLEMNRNDEHYHEYICSEAYRELAARVRNAADKDYSIIEADELQWRILVLRVPFDSVVGTYEDFELQVENVKKAVISGIRLISDCYRANA